jgi:DNA-binding GntR family transcriptional regulator
MITQKINHVALSEIAYEKIKQLILDNTLKAGQKIIQEKMAKELGISKIPLIQSLTRLNNEGLLTKIPRRGFCVREFTEDELNYIFDVRAALEMLCVSIIIKNYSPKFINKIKDFLNDFETYYKEKDGKKYYDTDVKFHFFIIRSSNNSLIIDIVEKFNILLLCYIKGFVLEVEESFEQHKNLIEAILNKDLEKAEKSMRDHITQIRLKLD